MSVNQDKDQFSEVETEVNMVGARKSSKIIFVVALILIGGLVYYFFLYDDSGKKNEEKQEAKVENIDKLVRESTPVAQEVAPRVVIPAPLPELPALVAPPVPSTPVAKAPVLELPKISSPPPSMPKPPGISPPSSVSLPGSTFSGYSKERRGSGMLVISKNSAKPGTTVDADGNIVDNKDQISLDDSAPLEKTGASQARATKVGNLDYMIVQGKMLDAVLETAINSDLDGVLRAVISRDVYAESGTTVLIPKGSRLIGEYTYDGADGQIRVDVTWKRVILPHGVDVAVDSPGVDELGRKGLTGIVDDKVANVLMTSLAVMGISVGAATLVSHIPGMDNQVTTVITDPTDPNFGKQTSTTTLPFNIVAQSINDMSSSLKSIVKKYEDIEPTIYVDQGTLIKVFVMRDLFFPREAVAGIKLVQ